MDLDAWKSKWTRQGEARGQSLPDILGEARARVSTANIEAAYRGRINRAAPAPFTMDCHF